jgi:hypothetical protein
LLAQDKTYQGPEDASEPQVPSPKKKKKPKKGVKSTAVQYGHNTAIEEIMANERDIRSNQKLTEFTSSIKRSLNAREQIDTAIQNEKYLMTAQ